MTFRDLLGVWLVGLGIAATVGMWLAVLLAAVLAVAS